MFVTEFRASILASEAATGGVLWKKFFLKILLNSQENTCAGRPEKLQARVSFLIKLQAGLKLYLKRGSALFK